MRSGASVISVVPNRCVIVTGNSDAAPAASSPAPSRVRHNGLTRVRANDERRGTVRARRQALVAAGTGLMTPHPLRWLWFSLGWIAVALGAIGIVIPGLPTTVFFIIAAACFSRSSPRFEEWVLNLPGVGPMVRDYRAGIGMPGRAKVGAVASIVIVCGASATFAVERLWIRGVIIAAGAIGVAWILWRVPTRPPSSS